ncbi:MAG: type II secretion system minor pseudopilin GspJ [Woeseiaceae bacterium]
MTRRQCAGFTLIEILVAVAVFGLLATFAYATLGQTLDNATMLTDRMDRLEAVQRTVRFLGDDLLQAAPRPVRGDLGDNYVPAISTSLTGDFALELTHGGWSNPAGLPRGTLQRSAYRIEDGKLIRYHWNVLDRTFSNQPVATVLLDDVESLAFHFLQADGKWSDTWPPEGAPAALGLRARPRAVQFVLTLTDEGEISRLIEVAP